MTLTFVQGYLYHISLKVFPLATFQPSFITLLEKVPYILWKHWFLVLKFKVPLMTLTEKNRHLKSLPFKKTWYVAKRILEMLFSKDFWRAFMGFLVVVETYPKRIVRKLATWGVGYKKFKISKSMTNTMLIFRNMKEIWYIFQMICVSLLYLICFMRNGYVHQNVFIKWKT